eukprot:1187839-Prorocentrum_minimum.AAC.4
MDDKTASTVCTIDRLSELGSRRSTRFVCLRRRQPERAGFHTDPLWTPSGPPLDPLSLSELGSEVSGVSGSVVSTFAGPPIFGHSGSPEDLLVSPPGATWPSTSPSPPLSPWLAGVLGNNVGAFSARTLDILRVQEATLSATSGAGE